MTSTGQSWEWFREGNTRLDVDEAWKRLRPTELSDQFALRFEKASLVYFEDGSQELFDRLEERNVWATVPDRSDPFYSIDGFGKVYPDQVSIINARKSLRTRSATPSHEQLEVLDAVTRGLEEGSAKLAELVQALTPLEFEEFVADVISKLGFNTVLTPATNDNGVDVFAVAYAGDTPERGSSTIIQCKKTRRTVGVRLVRELAGAKLLHGAAKALLITTSHFSPRALEIVEDPMYFGVLADLETLYRLWIASEGYLKRSFR